MQIEYALAMHNPRGVMSKLYQAQGKGRIDDETVKLTLAITAKYHPLGMALLYTRELADRQQRLDLIIELSQRVERWHRVRALYRRLELNSLKQGAVTEALAMFIVGLVATPLNETNRCKTCKGRGLVADRACERCGGTGRKPLTHGPLRREIEIIIGAVVERSTWSRTWKPILDDMEQLLLVWESEATVYFEKQVKF